MKKKPEGIEWADFVSKWQRFSHVEKVALAKNYGASFDTAKHWISNDGSGRKVEKKEPEPIPIITETFEEIFAIPTKTKLDFVSFDLETSELKADFSALLSAVIKPFDQEPAVFRCDEYPNWKEGRRADDLDICADVVKELSRHAVVITHYGTGFDMRYIRAKMMKHGLPALPPMFAVDTYYIAKANMMVGSRRLEAICKYLKLGLKSTVAGATWVDAALNGDSKAIDEVVAHNVQDCYLLEKLAMIMFPYLRSLKRL